MTLFDSDRQYRITIVISILCTNLLEVKTEDDLTNLANYTTCKVYRDVINYYRYRMGFQTFDDGNSLNRAPVAIWLYVCIGYTPYSPPYSD